jgi:TolA-binding protein
MMAKRFVVAGLSCALSLALVAGLSRAQETQEKKKEGAAKSEEKVRKASLPDYFGQIGLSDKQKDDVRRATQEFDEKIASIRKQILDLEKQIDEQEEKKLAAAENLLTEGQKTALKERRETATREKAARKTKKANGDEKKP